MRNTIRNSIIALAVISICAMWFTLVNQGDVTVAFASIGQGDGALIRTSGGRHILVDAGPPTKSSANESAMKTFLVKSGVSSLDVIIVSHYHDDHYGGILGIVQEFGTKLILMPKPINEENQKVADEIEAQISAGTAIVYMGMGESFSLGSEIYAETIFYTNETSDENDRSLVTQITCRDTKFLFTGDITTKAELRIVKEVAADKLDVDVVKVAHHGSKYSSSTEFFEATSPEFAVISVGKNTYGHPTQEAIDRIAPTAQVLRTDQQGTIEFVIGDNGIKKIRER